MGLHNGWWAAIFWTTGSIYEYHKAYLQDCDQQEMVILLLQNGSILKTKKKGKCYF